MNFNDLVKNKKQINFIKEAYTGQFTIGFELEGICTWRPDTSEERFYLPDYGRYEEGERPEGGPKLLKKYLDDLFNIEGSSGNSKIEKDSSLNVNGFNKEAGFSHAWNFEYATNKIPFNPQNIEKIYKALGQLNEEGIYTNNSCGFHIHMSFPEIDKKSVAWIMCCIAIDKNLIEDMLYLDTDDEGGELYLFDSKVDESGNEIDGYARIDFLEHLSFAIKGNDYKKIDSLLNEQKYRVLHIHGDNGTIEWRGPRGFLNYDDDKIIKSFILKWFRVISKIAKMTQSLTYSANGFTIDKEELLSHLTLKNFDLNTPEERKKRLKNKNLYDVVDETPVRLFSLSVKAIQNIYAYNDAGTIRIIYKLVSDDMFGEEWASLKNDVFNFIFEKYAHYFSSKPDEIMTFCEMLWYPLISNKTSLMEKLNDKNMELLTTLISDIILRDISNQMTDEIYEMAEDLNILNSKIFVDKIKKKYQANEVINFHTILDVSTNLPTYLWNILLSNRYIHFVSLIEMVPEKYQIRMVQKDPYNIQYINNPTQNAIKMAKEKISNVKDFIRGE